MGWQSNLWSKITFEVEGQRLERWLVLEVDDFERQLSTACSVGQGLRRARPGDKFVVQAPGGDVVVKVFEVS